MWVDGSVLFWRFVGVGILFFRSMVLIVLIVFMLVLLRDIYDFKYCEILFYFEDIFVWIYFRLI